MSIQPYSRSLLVLQTLPSTALESIFTAIPQGAANVVAKEVFQYCNGNAKPSSSTSFPFNIAEVDCSAVLTAQIYVITLISIFAASRIFATATIPAEAKPLTPIGALAHSFRPEQNERTRITIAHYKAFERKANFIALFTLGCFSLAWIPTSVPALMLRDIYGLVWMGALAGIVGGTATAGTGYIMRLVAIGVNLLFYRCFCHRNNVDSLNISREDAIQTV